MPFERAVVQVGDCTHALEFENIVTTIRYQKNNIRIFSCQLTTISPTEGRITNANGSLNFIIKRLLHQELKRKGFKMIYYERKSKDGFFKTKKVKV
jgi:hypothetical protein